MLLTWIDDYSLQKTQTKDTDEKHYDYMYLYLYFNLALKCNAIIQINITDFRPLNY